MPTPPDQRRSRNLQKDFTTKATKEHQEMSPGFYNWEKPSDKFEIGKDINWIYYIRLLDDISSPQQAHPSGDYENSEFVPLRNWNQLIMWARSGITANYKGKMSSGNDYATSFDHRRR
jgi:hypothetical protein